MTLEEYARQQQQRPEKYAEPPPEQWQTSPTPVNNPIAAAQKIIAEYNLVHKMSEGCRLQILHDIEFKENPFKLLLYAAEALGQLDYKGDVFYLQVQEKLKQAYGYDISEADSFTWDKSESVVNR